MRDLDYRELIGISKKIRAKVVEMSHQSSAPHLGSSLSCIDILVAAYWGVLNNAPEEHKDPNRDRFILSKGHAAAALYATLAYRGFFPYELLDTYTKPGSVLAEHPSPNCVPGIEAATGSLGHGLPIALGMALAAKIQNRNYHSYALMSDGECNEGSVWEAAMMASARSLSNLTVIIDFNKWQATGRSVEILGIEPLKDKWESFGWHAQEINGHHIADIVIAMDNKDPTRPNAIIAHTVKGKGVSFMEDDNNWHYRIPNAEEVQRAHRELEVTSL